MNTTATSAALMQAQNLAQPFVLSSQLKDMVRAQAFYADIAGDIKRIDEEEGNAPAGADRVLRERGLRAIADLLGGLNNVIEDLDKINGKSLVPAPKLRETIYEAANGFVAEGDQGVPLTQYLNMLYASLNQMFATLPNYTNQTAQNAKLFELQHRLTSLTSLFPYISTASQFVQHRVFVDDSGRAVIQLTNLVVPYTVEDQPRAFYGNPRTFVPAGQRATYGQTGSRFFHDAEAGATDLTNGGEGGAAVSNLSEAGLAEAAANAQALAGGVPAQHRDPNAY